MPSDLNKITNPSLYEINTWPWLEAISRHEATAVDLGSVPDRYWEGKAELWFHGVGADGLWQARPRRCRDRVVQLQPACQLRRRPSGLASQRCRRVSLLR